MRGKLAVLARLEKMAKDFTRNAKKKNARLKVYSEQQKYNLIHDDWYAKSRENKHPPTA